MEECVRAALVILEFNIYYGYIERETIFVIFTVKVYTVILVPEGVAVVRFIWHLMLGPEVCR